MTIKAQTDDPFTVTAMVMRQAVSHVAPGWVSVSTRCDVAHRRLRVWLDGPWWRRRLAGRRGRGEVLQHAILAANLVLDEAARRGLDRRDVLLEVWWR
jgi:hypothetical protein